MAGKRITRISHPYAAVRVGEDNQVSSESKTSQQPPTPDAQLHTRAVEDRDHVIIVRPAGEILFASRALDQPTEDVVGASVYDFVEADQHADLSACLTEVFAGNGVRRIELEGLKIGGDPGWYDCRISPNLRSGRIVSATIVAHNVSQYKQAQARLEAQVRELQRALADQEPKAAPPQPIPAFPQPDPSARLRALLDHAGDAIFVSDPVSTTIIDLNETAARWLRAPRDELIGKRIDELDMAFPILIPEDADLQFTETRDTRRPIILGDHVQRRADGSTFPVEVAVARHRLNGSEYILAVVRDVKERHASKEAKRLVEDSYRLLLDQSWDAVFITGRGGEIEDVNRAAVELFGYPRDEFTRLDAKKLFERALDIRRFQAQMSAAGTVEDLEVRLLTRDGRSFAALLSARRRPTLTRGIRGYQCIVRPLEVPSEPAEATTAPAKDGETVLVAARGADLAGTRSALRAAGMRVLSADGPDSAVQAAKDEAGDITAIIYDTDLGKIEETLTAIEEAAPLARVVLMGSGRPSIPGSNGAAKVLHKPVHPLSLVQHVRGE